MATVRGCARRARGRRSCPARWARELMRHETRPVARGTTKGVWGSWHEQSLHFPYLHFVDPCRVRHQQTEPTLHRIGEAFVAVMGEEFAIDAEA